VIIAIALCAISAFTFITCIAMRGPWRPDELGEEDVEQSIEIRVPAIIYFQYRTKRCTGPQQQVKVPPAPASSTALTAPTELAAPTTPMAEAEPDTRPLPHLPRPRYQDPHHQDPRDARIPVPEDGEREG
jgi:hypothetical protein